MRFAYISGQDPTARRRRIVQLYRDGKIDVLIASTILDEGFDAPATRFLVLAGGGKAEHRQAQRIGRGMRSSEAKDGLVVVDFLDRGKYLGAHARQREKAYRRERAYTVHEITRTQLEEVLAA